MKDDVVNAKPYILVTGGAGYIGTHAVKALIEANYIVIVLDNLVYGHQDLVKEVLGVKLVVGDLNDRPLLEDLFSSYPFTAVIHFAAFAYVGESMDNPSIYYQNNVAGTLTLLETMLNHSVDKLVFSSTCATYAIPEYLPINETHAQNPINPYGQSKLMVEKILKDFDRAYQLKSVIFRYFNAAGADPTGQLGEDHQPETHLIPLVLLTALGNRQSISVYGTDYPTPDGTCIRDYIHVTDLAQAHILGLEYLLQGGKSEVFNLGNGQGFSVKEIIETAQIVTGKKIMAISCERRAGDPPILVGSSEKVQTLLGWQLTYSGLADIITHAWKWHQNNAVS